MDMIGKQIIMRPQDVVILLKKLTRSGRSMNGKELSESLGISQSEVSEAMERNLNAHLTDDAKVRVNIVSLREFLIYGIKYCFPVKPGAMVRGIPTAVSSPLFSESIVAGDETFVWKCKEGTHRGQSVTPLFHTVPLAVKQDDELYSLLAIVDALRIGRARERNIAIQELDKILTDYAKTE